jgi:hypothetical protein
MTCTLGEDKDGNRFIMCRRGGCDCPTFEGVKMHWDTCPHGHPGQRTILAQAPATTPWTTGAQVNHRTHGFGIVHSRTEDQVAVIFKKDPPGKIRHFILGLVGDTMRVVN